MIAIKKKMIIIENEEIASNIYSMWIQSEEISSEAVPGQFVSLYCQDGSRILPRPISICEIDKEGKRIRLVYRVASRGTREFAALGKGDTIEVMGPLGNGFTLEGDNPILIGGGIGIPPMLELAKQLKGRAQVVLGYRDQLFLHKEFEAYGQVHVATDDGSYGSKGNVIDAIMEQGIKGDIIFACGPTPMLKGIKNYAIEQGIKAKLSMEERMACGIGACLACVCNSKDVDHHSHVKNKRVCKEGPVFDMDEVEL